MQKDLSHRLATLPLSRRLWETLGIFADIWNYEVLVFQSGSLTVGKILLSLLLVVLGIAFARRISRFLVSRIAQRVRLDRGGAETVQTFLFYALLILLFLVLLQVLQVPLTLFTLFGSAVALGVGFGTQNIINNFISGLILMIERPIKIGDVVEIENVRGVVDHIGARSTRIRTTDNLVLVLPNSNFLEKPVINWHLLDRRIRGSVKVGAAYGSDARLVEKKLLEAVAREERVLRRPTPQVLFRDFGADSLEFELLFWMEPRSVVEKQEMESRIRFSIDELFRECGITIAFPQRDVHLDTAGPIAVRLEGTPSSAAPS
ncbi:MAG: mechanosensitive ion channel protein [Candidatus Hydrogenedentota bacterium]|nr:MAG: mechanosensitive ion channel protein [Candidatus Hydrogenedentota bacterium]